jgi:hypothetical protein
MSRLYYAEYENRATGDKDLDPVWATDIKDAVYKATTEKTGDTKHLILTDVFPLHREEVN